MKIALIGYGKMGKEIKNIALEKKYNIVSILEETPSYQNLKDPDVAIEFTIPSAAYNNIKVCIDLGIPVVSGTTGWLNKFDDIKNYCLKKNGSLIYASNFSLGVNLFFEINQKIASFMKKYVDYYSIQIDEVHHIEKKDEPSGTSISIANNIINEYENLDSWKLNQNSTEKELGIFSHRTENVFGKHIVTYLSKEDNIKISHSAFSRKSFALGAICAAEFLFNKKGVYTMKDVFNI